MKVCVLGLGYVGLTLALILAENNVKVYGVDSKKETISLLRKKKAPISEHGIEELIQKHIGNNLKVHENIPDEDYAAHIISVGTPLDEKNQPIMDYVISAAESIGKKLKKDQLVVLRSTVPIETTQSIVVPILENSSGLKAGVEFSVVFAPERTAEGVALKELRTNPQIIGGMDGSSVEKAKKLFSIIAEQIVEVSNIETAEMIKLIDNTYRDVYFAFSNEIALICEMLNINAWECISKANHDYPRNKIPVPSPGVGGPCLTKDPHILSYTAQTLGFKPELIIHSRWINEFVPSFLAKKISRKLNEMKKSNPKVFVVGFAFKGFPETDDIRKSTTLILVEELKKNYKEIYGYDPVVKQEKISSMGIKAVNTYEEGFEDADCVVVMNNHKSYSSLDIDDLIEKTAKPCLFVDCWNLFPNISRNNIVYTGVGFD